MMMEADTTIMNNSPSSSLTIQTSSSSSSSPRLSLDILPRELLFMIMKLLRPIDVLRMRRVNKRWAQISRDDSIWLPFVSKILPSAVKLFRSDKLNHFDLSELYCRSQFCPFTHETIARYRQWFELAKTETSLRQPIKIVAVGTGAVGKTCLLNTFIHGIFPHQYAPIIADSTSVTLSSYRGTKRSLLLWDIPVSAGYALNDRVKAYTDTDMFLLCYSIADLTSFEDIETKWIPELQTYCPHAPCILVGLKTDLRDNRETAERMRLWYGREETLTREEGQLLACKIGAKYLECSALEGVGVHEVFIAAAHLTWLLRCFGNESNSNEDDQNQWHLNNNSRNQLASCSNSTVRIFPRNESEDPLSDEVIFQEKTSSSSNNNGFRIPRRGSGSALFSSNSSNTNSSNNNSSNNNSPFRIRSSGSSPLASSDGCVVQ